MRFFSNVFGAIKKHKIKFFFVFIIVGALIFYFLWPKSATGATTYTLTQAKNGSLTVAVSGSGQVSPDKQVELKPKASGNVISVQVKQGDYVTQGQALMQLEATDAQKSVRDAENNLKSAQISLQKLLKSADSVQITQAETDLAQAKRDLEDLLDPADDYDLLQAQNAVTQAERDLQQKKDDRVQKQKDLEDSVKDAYDNIIDTSAKFYDGVGDIVIHLQDAEDPLHDGEKFTIDDIQKSNLYEYMFVVGNLNEADSVESDFQKYFSVSQTVKRSSADEEIYSFLTKTLEYLNKIQRSLDTAKKLVDKYFNNYDETDDFLFIKTEIDADLATVNGYITDLKASKKTIDENDVNTSNTLKAADDAIETAQDTLVERQESLSKLREGPTENEIASAKEKITLKELSLEDVKIGSDALDIASQKLVIQQRENDLSDARDELDNYVVRAPFDGQVAALEVSVGDSVNNGTSDNGTAVATLITKQMIADISLNEVDAVKVSVGNPTTVTFDALPELEIEGTLAELDNLGVSEQGVVTYGAKVAFDVGDERVKSGLSVTADIQTQKKDNVLIVPSSAVKSDNNLRYVEILPTDVVTKSLTEQGNARRNVVGRPENTQIFAQNLPNGAGGTQEAFVPRKTESGMTQQLTTSQQQNDFVAIPLSGTGGENVSVVSQSQPVKVFVQVGLENDTESEITNGDLSVGQYVVLTKKTEGATSTTSTNKGIFGTPPAGAAPGGAAPTGNMNALRRL
jgi:HlyD family secretion protein